MPKGQGFTVGSAQSTMQVPPQYTLEAQTMESFGIGIVDVMPTIIDVTANCCSLLCE
jgi:hypothetical protein